MPESCNRKMTIAPAAWYYCASGKGFAMRLCLTRAALVGVGLSLAGCVGAGNQGFVNLTDQLGVDPQDAAGRAVEGAVLGATLGASLGAIFSLNPGLGATWGTEIGGPLGAAVGIATAEPLPTYKPLPVPAAVAIPEFYDAWPPGYDTPPPGTIAPAPQRRG